MRKTLFTILSILLLSSAVNAQSFGDMLMTVEYTNKIEGYDVIAIWRPAKVRYGHVIGPSVVEFTHENGNSFTISAHHFSLREELVSVEVGDYSRVTQVNQKYVALTYPNVNRLLAGETFGTTDVPFFFQDVNFDGQKELVIVEADNGQRGVATFKVHEIDEGEWTSYADITYIEPYVSLDELSIVNKYAKEIVIYYSSGYCHWMSDIYKLRESEDGYYHYFELVARMEQNMDEDGKCYEHYYDVTGGGRRFMRKIATD